MAFSLEAAIVTPLVLGTWVSMLAAAPPVCADVLQAARLENAAVAQASENQALYQAEIISAGDRWTTGLRTSPQAVVEIISLAVDDIRLLARLLSSEEIADYPGGVS